MPRHLGASSAAPLRLCLAALCIAAAIPVVLAGPGPELAAVVPAAAVQAAQADRFVDSIGVATHLTYTDTAYGNWQMVKQRLAESGIRHIRDGWGTGSQFATDRLRELATQHGVRATFVTDPRLNATPEQLHAMIRDRMGTGLVEAVEGPNEFDISGRPDWPGELRRWTERMASFVRGDAATRGMALVGPSIAHQTNRQAFEAVGDLSPWVDFGNAHDYPGGKMMTDGIIDTVLSNNSVMTGGRPLVATETGYSTGVDANDALHPPVAEREAGILLPRIHLEHFRRGVQRTFSYELVDEFRDARFESNFGLLRNDFSPKPAFTSVANTIKLLADPGPAFASGSLAFRLDGADANTRTLLLQKRDGTFHLALWQQTEVWDGPSRTLRNPADVPVTLQLASPAASVRTFRPSVGTAPQSSVGATASVPLTSSEDVVLIEVRPAPAPAPGRPDLAVTDIAWSSTTAGQPVRFSATVTNRGTAPTPAGTIVGVGFSVDGRVVNWSDTSTASLAAGASRTVTANSGPSGSATWTATAGTRSVDAYVDDIDRIPESDEANNRRTESMLVTTAPPGRPDLAVTDVAWSSATAGQPVRFSATVTNRGTAATPAGTIVGVGFSVDGRVVTWSDTSSASLAAGASRTVTANSGPTGSGTWTATAGTRSVDAYVDDINRIPESDEANNRRTESMAVRSA